jgi:hypothetical protein
MTTTRTLSDSRRTRMTSLTHANEVRVARRDARERIKRLPPVSGAQMAKQIMLAPSEWANGMSLERLLSAIRGFGRVRIKEVAAGAATVPLGQLGYAVRAGIASECALNAEHLSERRRSPLPDVDRRISQAQDALAEANRVRLARARALAHIAQAPNRVTGAFRAAGLIGNSRRGDEFDRLAVKKVIAAIPDVGVTGAGALMAKLGILESTQLGMLSETRARQIAAAARGRYGADGFSVISDSAPPPTPLTFRPAAPASELQRAA